MYAGLLRLFHPHPLIKNCSCNHRPKCRRVRSRVSCNSCQSQSPSAHYVLAGRNHSKISPVIRKINDINPKIKLTFVELDLLDNASVRKAAEAIKVAVDGTIDVLVNNAGIAAKRIFP